MVKSILERLRIKDENNDNSSKTASKEFPKLMSKIIERELSNQSVLMPDGRFVAPNNCDFKINPVDHGRLEFVIREIECQLSAQTNERLKDKKKFDSKGEFTVRIKADPHVAEGNIVCDFSSKLLVKPTEGGKDAGDRHIHFSDVMLHSKSEKIDGEDDYVDATVDSDEEETQIYVEDHIKRINSNSSRQVKLVVINHGKSNLIAEGESIAVPANRAEMIIGKSPRADVVIPYPFIGREQIRLIFQDDENVYVQNIGKTNPTYLNGDMLSGEAIALLQKRDKLQVADFVMVVTDV